MASTSKTGSPAGSATGRRGIRLGPKPIAAILIGAAALWFILANTATVHIHLWIPTVSAPMWLVLVIVFVAGLVTGLLLQRRNKKQPQL